MPEKMITSSKNKNVVRGRKGEAEAIAFLEKTGYKIIATNFKVALGEIDIVAKDKDERIIFVEVKARDTARFGYPREAVTLKKQQTIRQVAQMFLRVKHLTKSNIRFDIVEILAGEITHIKNAF